MRSLDRHLRRAERRESQLLVLALGLLCLVGTTFVVNQALSWFGGAAFSATNIRVLGGLFFLVLLFCGYTVHIRRANGTMRDLLIELNTMAASNVEVDAFLDSINRKIAAICTVDTCQIALLSRDRSYLTVRAAYARGGLRVDPVGVMYLLERSSMAMRVVASRCAVVLSGKEVARLRARTIHEEPFAGLLQQIEGLLVVPMMVEERPIGIIALGSASRFRVRFNMPRIVMAQSFAAHAAAAVDQANLRQQAIRDPLTELYNRRHLSDVLLEEIEGADRDQQIAILMCDLDRFKAINDERGHQTGDEVLRAVAKGILESTRGADVVSRWGGDEIVVLLARSSRDGALVAAERVRKTVRRIAAEHELDFDVSIGIAFYPQHGTTEDELMRVADRALYTAKQTGERIHVGDAAALGPHSARVVFQPIVALSSGTVIAYEALARDPEGSGNVEQLFEKHRAIGRLRELKQVVFKTQLAAAGELGLPGVFLNVDFELLRTLAPVDPPAGLRVVLELSEREALGDLDEQLATVRAWRERGYEFAIDDFGAGFISYPFLSLLVPQYVKVDRTMICQALSSAQFREFLALLLDAVRTYTTAGVIAEGIENEQELQVARDLGIDHAQGFLFGRPNELVATAAGAVSDPGHHVLVGALDPRC